MQLSVKNAESSHHRDTSHTRNNLLEVVSHEDGKKGLSFRDRFHPKEERGEGKAEEDKVWAVQT